MSTKSATRSTKSHHIPHSKKLPFYFTHLILSLYIHFPPLFSHNCLNFPTFLHKQLPKTTLKIPMGKKNTQSHEEEHHQNHKDNNTKNKGDKSNDFKTKNNPIVFKVDLHCEGCANKIVKVIRSSEGVEGVKCEWTASKISVLGDVDILKLREKIEQRTNKKVEVISPLPKKDKADGNADKKSKEKEDNNNKDSHKKSKDDKKPKELTVTTAVLKVRLHCEGCIHKIHKIVTKTKGYKEMSIDKQKDLVTVTGAIDMKSLAENLKKHLKKNVEIVPPKGDGEKKEKGDKKDGGDDQKSGGEKAANGGGHRMQMQVPYGFPYPPPFNTYGPGFYGGDMQQFQHVQYPYGPVHAPQMFSDENPNACTVM
ncbi:hypothetical protein LIER_27094 [Lithospermum erythrorhizon]|uniref:HMA domain-containing protein n=1 Tax=Lithospermum erythrorhizon TaxID=34254 RepID=A0AAV3RCB5_LITER